MRERGGRAVSESEEQQALLEWAGWESTQKEIKIANGETFCSMCGKPLKGV